MNFIDMHLSPIFSFGPNIFFSVPLPNNLNRCSSFYVRG